MEVDEVFQEGGDVSYGRCDECGAPCNALGCTADQKHNVTVEGHIPSQSRRDSLHIAPGAFKDLPKTVPLVVYGPGGERRVVGSADISQTEGATGPSLNLDARITDPEVARTVKQATDRLDGFAIYKDPRHDGS